MILFRHQIIGLFIPASGEEAVQATDYAIQYLTIMSSALIILYFLHVARNTLQGLGNTRMSMISGLAEFIMRTFMAIVMTRFLGGVAVMWGEVLAWSGADLVLMGALLYEFQKLKKLESGVNVVSG